MPKWVKYLTQMPPVFTDGLLLVTSSFCAAVLTYLSSEDSFRYVNPYLLFWLKVTLGSVSSSASALVAFRSRVYTQYQQQAKADATGQTQTVETKPTVKT